MDTSRRSQETTNLSGSQGFASQDSRTDLSQELKKEKQPGYYFLIIVLKVLLTASMSLVQHLQVFMKIPDKLETYLLSISLFFQIIFSILIPAFIIRKYMNSIVAVSMTMLAGYVIFTFWLQEKDYNFLLAGPFVGIFSALLEITVYVYLTFNDMDDCDDRSQRRKKENRMFKHLVIYFSLTQVSHCFGTVVTTVSKRLDNCLVTYDEEYYNEYWNISSNRFTIDNEELKDSIDGSVSIIGIVAMLWAIGAVAVWVAINYPCSCCGKREHVLKHSYKPWKKYEYLTMLRQYFKIHSFCRMCSSFCLGLQQAFFISVFVLMYNSAHPETHPLNTITNNLYLNYSAASIIGCCLAYFPNKYLKRRIPFYCAFLLNFAVVGTVLAVKFIEPSLQFSEIIFHLTALLWGLSDGILKVQIIGYYGTKFSGRVECALARHYWAFCLGQLIGYMSFDIRVQLVLMIFYLPAVLCYRPAVKPLNSDGSADFAYENFSRSFSEVNYSISRNTSFTDRRSLIEPRCMNNPPTDFY